MHGLKASEDLVRGIKEWTTGDLYKATGKRQVLMQLQRNADGSVMGYARDAKGRFIGHARWVKTTTVASRLALSVGMLAGHALLVEISRKLDRIERKVDRIEQILRSNTREALKAAIEGVYFAIDVSSSDNKRHLLTNLILSLHTVIKQEIGLLKLQIQQAPEPPQKFIKGLVWDTSPETRQALLSCEESLVAILEGVRAIGTAALALEEPRFAWSIVAALLRNLEEGVPLDHARILARRILPRENELWPELPWSNALEVIPQSRAVVEAKLIELDEQGPEYLELELREDELEALRLAAD